VINHNQLQKNVWLISWGFFIVWQH